MTEVATEMTLGRLPHGSTTSSNPGLTTAFALDTFASASDSDVLSVAFIPKVGVPITHIGFRHEGTAGTPGAGSQIIGLQGLNSSGQPDGTFLGGGSPASKSFQPTSATNGKFVWIELDNPYTSLTATPICWITRQTASDAVNYITVTPSASSMIQSRGGAPYALTRTGTTWTKSSEIPIWGVKNGATPTIVQGFPVENFGTHTFSNAAQAGLQFKLPDGLGSAYKVAKLCWQGDPGTTGTAIDARLSTSAGTEQSAYANAGIDSDFAAAVASAARHFEYPFTAPSDLTPGTLYTAHLCPTGGSQATDILYLDVTDENDLLAFPGGIDFKLMTRAGASGVFVAANSGKRRPFMWLEMQSMTVGSGSTRIVTEAKLLDQRKLGTTSITLRGTVRNATTGVRITGLAHDTAGLIISVAADVEAAPTVYAQASGNIETIATLGTYAAPTAGKCRFKEVDPINAPGQYEFQFADARYAVAGAKKLHISMAGANAEFDGYVLLDGYDRVDVPPSDAEMGATFLALAALTPIAANVERVNNGPIKGNGTAGNPWAADL